jgi:hypothetical protein
MQYPPAQNCLLQGEAFPPQSVFVEQGTTHWPDPLHTEPPFSLHAVPWSRGWTEGVPATQLLEKHWPADGKSLSSFTSPQTPFSQVAALQSPSAWGQSSGVEHSAHVPPMQARPGSHTVSQSPQCVASDWKSTHFFPHFA